MLQYEKIHGLQVDPILRNFIEKEALPGTGIDTGEFWKKSSQLILDLSPKNFSLLEKRKALQEKIDDWHRQNSGESTGEEYKNFLDSIGYMEPEPDDFNICTQHIDDEIARQAGPQLVVPVSNARYAINAANARWGSLYDALYGTDAISEENGAEKTATYNPERGQKVIEFAKTFLDETFPLQDASHHDTVRYYIDNESLFAETAGQPKVGLTEPHQFTGYLGHPEHPSSVLLKHNGLHVEIQINRRHPIGQSDKAGMKDICLEAALSTIIDFEDSVAAVDAEDKVQLYRNWLGLMKGTLYSIFTKGKEKVHRTLHEDRIFRDPAGDHLKLKGRSLMLVRNVGHLMATPMILFENGEEVPEGIVDAIVTSLCALHDLRGNTTRKNSKSGAIYIVKPKMHGPEEAAFANVLFNRVEDVFGLDRHTIKIGLMDEERRTSLNLKACIKKVKGRIFFINTGFLDRTGDEIHTSMEAGVMVRKQDMKGCNWLKSYETSNVANGLRSGLPGLAQIGKGMWAMPDRMAAMLEEKISHVKAGATTAWVPSPTAATLHTLHYHQTNVWHQQGQLAESFRNVREGMLDIPIAKNPNWSPEEIQEELDNNAQGILGYVVRWIDQGIGCSKVPDIHNIGLMEDRATLRISSQHIANWLHHRICTEDQVLDTMKRMAKVVDEQNAGDPLYTPMAPEYDRSIAFQAACELVFNGRQQPNGYTEPILHRKRKEYKQSQLASIPLR